MRIAILQFNPELRAPDKNIASADRLLQRIQPGELDLLVLPELAFSGYNFSSLEDIRPFLEPTANGPTARWAKGTASRLRCHVTVGYPEISSEEVSTNTSEAGEGLAANGSIFKSYNSALTVDASGTLVAHYRKSNLYYTDVTWSWPNPAGFETINLHLPSSPSFSHQKPTNRSQTSNNEGSNEDEADLPTQPFTPTPTTFAICMDLNPKHFTAPWATYELARHILHTNAKLLIATNAWNTRLTREELEVQPTESDHDTLSYWLARLRPLLDKGGGWKTPGSHGSDHTAGPGRLLQELAGSVGRQQERVIVIANRTGIEPGVCRAYDLTRGCPTGMMGGQRRVEREAGTPAEESVEPTAARPDEGVGTEAEVEADVVALEARYAGSSCVLGLRGDGRIRVYGQLGRAEERVLVVDTDGPPDFVAELVSREGGEGEE